MVKVKFSCEEWEEPRLQPGTSRLYGYPKIDELIRIHEAETDSIIEVGTYRVIDVRWDIFSGGETMPPEVVLVPTS
jgi:hypothetical protein